MIKYKCSIPIVVVGAGMVAHVMTFEVGAVLEDKHWQAPVYCFGDAEVWPESSPEDDLVEEDDEAGSYGNNSALNEALIGISISNSNEGNNELVSKSGNQELYIR